MHQLSRIIARAGRSLSNQARNGSSYSSSFKPMTMNELPVPSGSWAEQFNAKQKAYNMHLIIGVVFLAVSCVTSVTTDALFMNMGPELKNKK